MLNWTQGWELLMKAMVFPQLSKLEAHPLSLAPRRAQSLGFCARGEVAAEVLSVLPPGMGNPWDPGYREQTEASDLQPPQALAAHPPRPSTPAQLWAPDKVDR